MKEKHFVVYALEKKDGSDEGIHDLRQRYKIHHTQMKNDKGKDVFHQPFDTEEKARKILKETQELFNIVNLWIVSAPRPHIVLEI